MRRWLVLFSLIAACTPAPQDKDTQEYLKNFLDKEPLVVDYHSPTGEIGVAQNKIVVHFNQPMVPLTAQGEGMAASLVHISPHLSGMFKWVNTKTLIYQAKGNLPFSTTFTVTVAKGHESLLGYALVKDFVFTFSTPAPKVTDKTKVHTIRNEPIIGTQGPFVLEFNQRMDPLMVAKHVTLTANEENAPLSVACDEAPDKTIAKFCERLLVVPQIHLPMAANVSLKLATGLPGIEGDLTLSENKIFLYKTHGKFAVESLVCNEACRPFASLQLSATTPIEEHEFNKHIEFDPPLAHPDQIDVYWEDGPESLSLYPPQLAPNTLYKVTVGKTLRDIFVQGLSEEKTFTFMTGHFFAGILIPAVTDQVHVFADDLNLGFTGINLPQARSVFKTDLSDEDIIGFFTAPEIMLQTWQDNENVWTYKKEFTGEIDDQRRHFSVPVSDFLGAKMHGIVLADHTTPELISIDPDTGERKFTHHWLVHQITDLGIDAKLSEKEGLVWVTSLNTGENLSSVKITIYDNLGQGLFTGETDARGLLKTPGGAALYTRSREKTHDEDERPQRFPFYYFAHRGDDRAFLTSDWSDGMGYFTLNDYMYDETAVPDVKEAGDDLTTLRAHVLTDRGLYKPGETAFIKGYVREVTNVGLKAFSEPLRLLVKAPHDDKPKEIPLTPHENGNFATEFDVNGDAELGHYSVSLVANNPHILVDFGRTSFQVEQFRTPDFKVETQFRRSSYLQGEDIEVEIAGTYLFGAPLKEASLTLAISRMPSFYRPPIEGPWHFGRLMLHTDEDAVNIYESYDEQHVRLDAEGKFFLTHKTTAYVDPIELNFAATVHDLSGQQQGNFARLTVHPASFYLGASLSRFFYTEGEDVRLKVKAFGIDGKESKGVPVTADLMRMRWISVKKEMLYGQFETEVKRVEDKLQTCAVVTGEGAECVQRVEESGFYFYRLEALDAGGRKTVTEVPFYVTGDDFAFWPDTSHSVELVSDREGYRAGDVAKILVKSPYANAHALVSVERDEVLSHFQTEVKGSGLVEIPITENFSPNVFVRVVLIKGAQEVDPSQQDKVAARPLPLVKAGSVELRVAAEKKDIHFTAKTDKKIYRPNEKVFVNFSLEDPVGHANAEITLMVVDEGVILAGGYELENPSNTFFAPYEHLVGQLDNRIHYVGRQGLEKKLESEPSGGGRMPDYRKDFRPLAYFNGAIAVDKNGQATVSFSLPDQVTSFRLMAVASAGTDHFGVASSSLKTQKEVMLRPALPRFLRLGDKFTSAVVVHNNLGEGLDYKISVEATRLSSSGQNSSSVTVKPQSAATVNVSFTMDAETLKKELIETKTFKTAATVNLEANGGVFHDSVSLTVPLFWDMTPDVFATMGILTADTRESFVKGDVYEQLSGLHVSLSSDLLLPMREGITALTTYPYECLEQRLSKIYPFVFFPDRDEFFSGKFKEADKRFAHVEKFLTHLKRAQTYSGEFSLWPGLSPDPVVTLLVGEFLAEAKRSGHDVESLLTKLKERLFVYLDPSVPRTLDMDISYFTTLKANAVYLLYLLGEPATSRYDAVRAHILDYDDPTRAKVIEMLFAHNPQDPAIATWLTSVENSSRLKGEVASIEAAPSHFGIGISAKTATAGVVHALLTVDPHHPLVIPLVSFLLQQKSQAAFVSTAETREVLRALSLFRERFPRSENDILVKIGLNATELMQMPLSPSKPADQIFLPADKLPQKMDMTLSTEGEGKDLVVYKMAYTAFLKQERAYDWDQGIALHREYYDLKGNRVDDADLKHGETYKVVLNLFFADDGDFIVIDEPFAAGLKPLNFALATAGHVQDKTDFTLHALMPFVTHREFHDRKILLFIDHVGRGFYDFSYFATATNRGEFNVPQALAFEMYTPEVFGTTGIETLSVH